TSFIFSFLFYWIILGFIKYIKKIILDIPIKTKLYLDIFSIFIIIMFCIQSYICILFDESNLAILNLYILIGNFFIYFIIYIILFLLSIVPEFRIKNDYIIGNKYYRICAISGTLFLILLFLAG
ncbi:MAG: hypothetical protein IJH34_10115, partial [Romboutsia sp.]|nr:hypothetical protein [Romboutsia sp.]